MDLQISVFLLLIFFTAGHSLKCYDCTMLDDSCADQQVQVCPETSTCFSLTTVTLNGNITTKRITKGCTPNSCIPDSIAYNFESMSFSCCNTDLCNGKDAPVPSISTSQEEPNGKKCHNCYGQNCSDIVECRGSEDHCITHTGIYTGLPFTLKACTSKAICDFIKLSPYSQSFSCCEGNLCNGAESISQSFLFLCCSLLSFILLH